ncbi:amino acid adenylation domain-containing protein [Pseudoalteromonas rhizosphaerae]|uniref:Amino acid adenylation domain-containing protein n=1 Tax=Pseudoalteromonas rhizosphaerae TaxID=2518973 RepID=A0ABW8L1D6_9GAMM
MEYKNNIWNSVLDVVQYYSENRASKKAIIFEDNAQQTSVTYRQLYESSLNIAQNLIQHDLRGKSVVLVFGQGIEFVQSFLGCLLAQAIPVPVHRPAAKEKQWQKLLPIVNDSQAAAVVGEAGYIEKYCDWLSQQHGVKSITMLTFGDLSIKSNSNYHIDFPKGDALAFLQYTSGSTSTPKGAMVTHNNILSNAKLIARSFSSNEHTVSVSWLPLFHDAGMIGILMHLLYVGGTLVLMSPASFVQSPLQWLAICSKYKATYTGGPNFGYDLCVQRITKEQAAAEGLELSSLKGVFNGAEPVKWDTLQRFKERFEPFGFNFKAFVPCYGMAESTLMITGVPSEEAPSYIGLNKTKLENNELEICVKHEHIKKLPSCGVNQDDTEIIIVNRSDFSVLNELQEGEVWLRGPSVVKGYFNNETATQETFHAKTKCGKGPFLRTGDLGFLYEGQLFITGRENDLIIVNGKNHYPQDIESTIAKSIDCVVQDGIAVSSKEVDNVERVFVVVEIMRTALKKIDSEEVCRSIRAVVSDEHQLELEYIALVKPATILKTTSGKVKRRACLNAIFSNELSLIKGVQPYKVNSQPEVKKESANSDKWLALRQIVAKELNVEATVIEPSYSLTELGVNSLKAGTLAHILNMYSMSSITIATLLEASCLSALLEAHQWSFSARPIPNEPIVSHPISNTSFPLTDIQMGYVLGKLEQMKMGGVALQSYFEFDGDFDPVRLQAAWHQVVSQVPMLRAELDMPSMQRILPTVPEYPIKCEDISILSDVAQQKYLQNIRSNMESKTLDIEIWPPFELTVTKMSIQNKRLHVLFDGTFLDATSIMTIFSLFARYYRGKCSTPITQNFGFEYCCRNQIPQRDEGRILSSTQYWQRRISELPISPQLSASRHSTYQARPEFKRIYSDFSNEQLEQLDNLAKRLGVTRHVVLLATFAKSLASKALNQAFSINIPMQNRSELVPELASAIGHFSSFTLASFNIEDSTTLQQLATATMLETKNSIKHSAISGIELLDLIRRQHKNVFYPVVFTNLLDLEDRAGLEQFEATVGKLHYSITRTPQVQLDCQVMRISGGVRVCWDFDLNAFDEAAIVEMFAEYTALLLHLAQGNEQWPSDLNRVESEQHSCIIAANDTCVSCPPKTLIDDFLKCADVMPKKVAIIDGEQSITYRELLQYSNAASLGLADKHCQPGDMVIIAMQKSWHQLALAVAILQAGCVFIPVDPYTPTVRLQSIIKQANVHILITDQQTPVAQSVKELLKGVYSCDDILRAEQCNHLPIQNKAQPDELAYVIFTSGSTGLPKGVAIEHRSAMNTIVSINKLWHTKYDDTVLALSELTFDLAIYDLFGMLSVGGTVVLANASQSPQQWADLIDCHNVTMWNSVPASMSLLCDYLIQTNRHLNSLRATQLSGDWFPSSLSETICKILPCSAVINMGGATEASIWSIYYSVTGREHQDLGYIPYGKPLDNQRFYIVDEQLNPVEPGKVGELLIAGKGLARGYLNDEEKTQAAFFWCPSINEHVYRTGDLGTYQSDGNIRFCGRKDNQIKLNGYRIELGELENSCNQLPFIKGAIAVPYGEGDSRQIALFATADNGIEQGHALATKTGTNTTQQYLERQSIRTFDSSVELSEKSLGQYLSTLAVLKVPEFGALKYRYPSAGGIYAVQVYMHLLKSCGELTPGFYAYGPIDHQLIYLSPDRELYHQVEFGGVANITARANFVLYLVSDSQQVQEKYGSKARDFGLLEAGYMSQLLMSEAKTNGLGVCPLGFTQFSGLEQSLCLDKEQEVLHVLGVGTVKADTYNRVQAPSMSANSAHDNLPVALQRKYQQQVKSHLAVNLPRYMQPHEVCVLAQLPLTANSKVDVNALVNLIEKSRISEIKAEPIDSQINNEVLMYLKELWENLIGRRDIGLDDSFIEMGVNSISAVKMLTRINTHFQIELSLTNIFEHSTLRKLEGLISAQLTTQAHSAEQEYEEGTL